MKISQAVVIGATLATLILCQETERPTQSVWSDILVANDYLDRLLTTLRLEMAASHDTLPIPTFRVAAPVRLGPIPASFTVSNARLYGVSNFVREGRLSFDRSEQILRTNLRNQGLALGFSAQFAIKNIPKIRINAIVPINYTRAALSVQDRSMSGLRPVMTDFSVTQIGSLNPKVKNLSLISKIITALFNRMINTLRPVLQTVLGQVLAPLFSQVVSITPV